MVLILSISLPAVVLLCLTVLIYCVLTFILFLVFYYYSFERLSDREESGKRQSQTFHVPVPSQGVCSQHSARLKSATWSTIWVCRMSSRTPRASSQGSSHRKLDPREVIGAGSDTLMSAAGVPHTVAYLALSQIPAPPCS